MTAPPVRPEAPRYTVQDYARALGIILQKEIGVPFALYEVATGCLAALPEGAELDTPSSPLPPEVVQEMAQRGQADVRTVAPGSYQLTLVLYQANRPAVIAAGWFQGLARNMAEAERENRWLLQWIHSVSERLRLSEQMAAYKGTEDHHGKGKTAWEGLLALDHVIRRLRLYKNPKKNLTRILETAFELLPVQCLICLPAHAEAEPMIEGETLLTPEDCRDLADALATRPDFKEEDPVFINNAKLPPWGGRFPAVNTVLAFPIVETPPYGWLIAVNKTTKDDSDDNSGAPLSFRRSDAALLLPFVALLRLQALSGGRFQELRELVVGLARSLTAAIDAKDSYTFGHSERVARIAIELGRTLGLSSDELSDLYLAGLLHDVGKIGVPDGVLRKIEPLTTEEFDSIKQHVTIGYAILADLRPIRHLLTGVLYHHERWDGKGYPEGLQGEKIPLLARILAVADAYDAMSTDRPYRAAVPFAEVEKRLELGAGTQWDDRIVKAFFQCRQKIHAIRQRGVGESLRQALDGALRSKGSTNVL